MSDLISREAVLESLKTDYSLIMFDSYGNLTFAGERIIEAIKGVPSVEPEKCGDCINRKDMLKKLNNLCNNTCDYSEIQRKSMCDACNLSLVFDMINNAKSVEPERKTGKWIMSHDKNAKLYGKCNNCGMRNYAGYTNYCPDCGAKMMDEQTLKYADTDTAFGGLQSAT